MTLNELAIKYGTDKSSLVHNYCDFYESTLPKQPARILEIGYGKGASTLMWREWFGPSTEVHVLDLFEEQKQPSDTLDTFFHKGNAIDLYVLDKLRKYNFDVIIDDGSHNSRDQMITFFGLFNGGHYYIEDLHCCDEEFYRQGLPTDFTAKHLFNTLRFPHGWGRLQMHENIILIC